jgi:hypothetical protein
MMISRRISPLLVEGFSAHVVDDGQIRFEMFVE